ncbi:MAG: hypothetical protein ACRCXZ_03785 [Patescibacteria group bacterium]
MKVLSLCLFICLSSISFLGFNTDKAIANPATQCKLSSGRPSKDFRFIQKNKSFSFNGRYKADVYLNEYSLPLSKSYIYIVKENGKLVSSFQLTMNRNSKNSSIWKLSFAGGCSINPSDQSYPLVSIWNTNSSKTSKFVIGTYKLQGAFGPNSISTKYRYSVPQLSFINQLDGPDVGSPLD